MDKLSNRIVISPPFGQFFHPKGTTPILGSYTVEKRKGRVWRFIKTVRPCNNRQGKGWVNRIGLRNPGIHSVKFRTGSIYSIVGLARYDWFELVRAIPDYIAIELNLSCPNARVADLPPGFIECCLAKFTNRKVIAKMPPPGFETVEGPMILDAEWRLLRELVSAGVVNFHLCNTMPSAYGGISGAQLREWSVRFVEHTKQRYGNDISVIGGGGIYSLEDAYRYANAGADYLSLATVFFNPFRGYRLVKQIREEFFL